MLIWPIQTLTQPNIAIFNHPSTKSLSTGRIAGMQRVYCSGWIKNGPEGTIATTMMDANNTALAIASDLKQHVIGAQDAQDRSDLRRILLQRIGETVSCNLVIDITCHPRPTFYTGYCVT